MVVVFGCVLWVVLILVRMVSFIGWLVWCRILVFVVMLLMCWRLVSDVFVNCFSIVWV